MDEACTIKLGWKPSKIVIIDGFKATGREVRPKTLRSTTERERDLLLFLATEGISMKLSRSLIKATSKECDTCSTFQECLFKCRPFLILNVTFYCLAIISLRNQLPYSIHITSKSSNVKLFTKLLAYILFTYILPVRIR